jgi:hypothetical protein
LAFSKHLSIIGCIFAYDQLLIIAQERYYGYWNEPESRSLVNYSLIFADRFEMRRISYKTILVVLPTLMLSMQAHAGTGDVGAGILDPQTVDKKTIKRVCRDYPQAFSCNTLKDKSSWKGANDNVFAEPVSEELQQDPIQYNVYNANYE